MIMSTVLSYSLELSVIILALFPILYWIVNRSTTFRFNRIAILCGMVLSIAFPVILSWNFISSTSDVSSVMENLTVNSDILTSDIQVMNQDHSESSTKTWPWVAISVFIYLFGIVILIFREVISFFRLYKIISSSERTKIEGFTVCQIADNKTAPFSWGQYIFLQSSVVDTTDSIFIHEKAHTERMHWIDILFADLFCILLWYNPFAWMTRRLMKLNHEVEADSEVIISGIDTYDYQRMLVTKAMGMRAIPIANSLAADGRIFRKRVLNMSRRHSSKRTILIAIFAIPAFIVSGAIISSPVSAGLLGAISDFRFSKEPSTADIDEQLTPVAEAPNVSSEESDSLTVIPSPIEDQTALAEIIRLSLETIKPDKNTKVNIEIVVDKDGRVKDVSTNNPDGAQLVAAIDRQLNGIKFEQMTDDGQPVEVRFNIPVSFKAQE